MQMQSIWKWIKKTSKEKKEVLINAMYKTAAQIGIGYMYSSKSHFRNSNILRSGDFHLHNHITME